MDALFNLVLYKELAHRANTSPVARDLKARLDRAGGQMERILRDVRRYFAHFTDHSLDHSIRIAHNIGCLLRREQIAASAHDSAPALSSVDLFLLIGAALVHDVGMVVREGELDDLAATEEFGRLAAQWRRDDNDWYRRGVPRQLFAEYVRRHHARRSLEFMLDPALVPPALTDEAPQLARWLGTAAAGHSMDFAEICNERRFPTHVQVALGGSLQEECNPRFVALCLRLGDLFDINTSRVCPLLRHLSEPLGPISTAHWDQYAAVSISGLQPGSNITIEGTCPTQDSERVLREWLSWLEREAASATQITNTGEERYRLAIGRVQSQVTAAVRNGVPAYEFLEYRFNLDERAIFERLFGPALYGRPELALRELIQNAVDAQRAFIIHELARETDWGAASDEERSARFVARRAEVSARMPIRVRVAADADEPQRIWLSVEDAGIGMSRETIARYLLKVGRSRWGQDPITARLGLGSNAIGRFGVGFLSTLMLADKVVVDTRSCLPEEPGVCATIHGWQGFAATTPSARSHHGTAVRLLLRDNALASIDSLRSELARQAPLLEFPVMVVDSDGESALPQIDSTQTRTQTSIPMGSDGSRIILRRLSRDRGPITRWTFGGEIDCPELALCQDGIAIAAMRCPVAQSPEAAVFGRLGGIVDLRGGSRVALDLSRNLVEGEPEVFWRNLLPTIWNAISAALDVDTVARLAMTHLIESVACIERTLPYFLIPRRGLMRAIPDDVEALVVVESHRLALKGRRLDQAAWIIPPAPAMLPGVLRLFEGTEGDDAGLRYRKLISDDEGEEQRQIIATSTNVARHWAHVAAAFPWVSARPHDEILLSRGPVTGAVHVPDLLGFRLTDDWRIVFSDDHQRHMISASFGFEDIAKAARAAKLSYADLLVFLSLNHSRNDFGAAPVERAVESTMPTRLRAAALNVSDRQDEEDALLAEEESDRRRDALEEGRREWDQQSTLAPLWDEDARHYRGIARRHKLTGAVAPWERFPISRAQSAARRR